MFFLPAFLSLKFPGTARTHGKVLLAAFEGCPRAAKLLAKRCIITDNVSVSFLLQFDFFEAVADLKLPGTDISYRALVLAARDGAMWAGDLLKREGISLTADGVTISALPGAAK